jgi:pyruvate,water dikinase
LRALGLPVPPFFIIPPDEDIDLERLLTACDGLGNADLAVRSSAIGEDSAGLSFAGQFDTTLCVRTSDELVEAVNSIRSSVFSERLLAYCQQHGVDARSTRMAVVVQAMFPSVVSGVLFTADPTHPNDDACLVSAGWGLGEGIVSGQVDTDEYRITPSGIEARVHPDKRTMVRGLAEGGTALLEVSESMRGLACLQEAQLNQLVEYGRRLEAHFGRPQDIEWAVDDAGNIAILQTRPLTAIGPRSGRLYTWDNSNIVESYSGVTTPLTYSFARAAYETVYRQFCDVMGVSRSEIEANASTFSAMIGLIRGRIFYRLDSWYRVLTLLPGAKYNKRFMEQMMGVRKQAELGGDSAGGGRLRIVYLVWRVVRALVGLGRRTKRFKSLFDAVYSRYHHSDLSTLDANALVDVYRELERELLLNWKAPIINDFYAMIFYGVLKKLAPTHHNDLLIGEPGMESILPTREAMRMAEKIRATSALHRLFEENSDAEVLAAVESGAFPSFQAWLTDYLDRFGDRCMEELKLETKTLRDDATFVVAMLRNYLSRADLSVAELEAREATLRAEAEDAVSVPWHQRPLFSWILRRTRRHIRERENLRFARTRIFGLVRRIFRELGERLQVGGIIDEATDVFYLTVDEIVGLVEGTAVSARVRGVVTGRRNEFQNYSKLPAPSDRFETRGPVHLGNVFLSLEPIAVPEGDVLTGLGVSPGIVRERARVILRPDDDLSVNGQVMVCERTDPGWVPLFPTAGGLLVERGSALSHSAIVAREFGIPTVVGIHGLLERVTTGQWLELNGQSGTVQLDVKPLMGDEMPQGKDT